MSAPEDDAFRERYLILREKYWELRRNHRRLAGVALQLADALEAFVKGETEPNVKEILTSCSKIYPELAREGRIVAAAGENSPGEDEAPEIVEGGREKEMENGENNLNESDGEYYHGFCSRPKIPRTPHV